MARFSIDAVRVKPGARPSLKRRATDETFGWTKDEAKAALDEVKRELGFLQHRLYAESGQALLVVLQAMDAAGKDGVIRKVMTGMNPAGTKVTSFKAPAGREVAHDYLWRCHAACPGRGEVGVWNRSHYEDVLVVRVKGYVPEERWRPRYRHIREFERMLVDEGTRIVKIYLHVSKDEQRARLQDRIDDPEERWKHNASDLADRALWPQYMAAYEEAMAETSTADAPWYVVPADRKWARDLAVAHIVRHTLEAMDPQLPTSDGSMIGTVVV